MREDANLKTEKRLPEHVRQMFEVGRQVLVRTGKLPATRKELLTMGKEMLALAAEEMREKGEESIERAKE